MNCSDLISECTANGTLTLIEGEGRNERYQCRCSKIIKRNSVLGHLKSRYHIDNEGPEHLDGHPIPQREECLLCYRTQTDFYECVCLNKHCMRCHSSPIMRNCPMCRITFADKFENEAFSLADTIEKDIDNKSNDDEEFLMVCYRFWQLVVQNKDFIKRVDQRLQRLVCRTILSIEKLGFIVPKFITDYNQQ